ncbi:MAG: hypothetical protein DMD79_25025 [Candidatus Rokuibacteriota bacterium]|nr:MAG: hypothetical protein DMD79_25025 [Candidatus Rokubacteria bacterium]
MVALTAAEISTTGKSQIDEQEVRRRPHDRGHDGDAVSGESRVVGRLAQEPTEQGPEIGLAHANHHDRTIESTGLHGRGSKAGTVPRGVGGARAASNRRQAVRLRERARGGRTASFGEREWARAP